MADIHGMALAGACRNVAKKHPDEHIQSFNARERKKMGGKKGHRKTRSTHRIPSAGQEKCRNVRLFEFLPSSPPFYAAMSPENLPN